MSTVVIMPGGFHPFHAGHYALYQSAVKAFPNAEVYVAATNDQSERPFPFALKEKLAKLAGVEPGRFVQVKSPFKASEIMDHYDPDQDVLIFVRSEKDRNESPKPGGTKKDGSPSYFQPWTGKDVQPFSKHAYFAYLPTVEFGPGITSATEIRKAWPTLNDKRKLAMVMSLYPTTQNNPKLAQNVVSMFDQVMGGQINEGFIDWLKSKFKKDEPTDDWFSRLPQEEQDALHAAYYSHGGSPEYKAAWERHQARSQPQPTGQGAHGSVENEVKMFLNGTKPAALVNSSVLHLWKNIIASGKYIVDKIRNHDGTTSYIVAQPDEQDRVEKLHKLVQTAQDAVAQGDMRVYQNSNYHRWMGKLLGYPPDKIEAFIRNYFKDTQDTAKKPVYERELAEVGDQPYQTPSRWRGGGDGGYTKSIKLPDGRNLEIVVEYQKPYALVNFYVDSSQWVTGGGDAVRILSTVANEINDFMGKYKPDILAFTASMANQSRIKLYDRFADRVVKSMPAFQNYTNISDDEDLYGDLIDFADERHDIQEQILYVFASPKYMKNIQNLQEFAPGSGDDGEEPDEEEILRKLASQWWNGTEQQMIKAQRTLEAMGWEIGEDEGYDQGGVFVVRSNDEHGKSYISWPHEELEDLTEAGSPAQQAAIAINMKKHHKKPKHVDEVATESETSDNDYLDE